MKIRSFMRSCVPADSTGPAPTRKAWRSIELRGLLLMSGAGTALAGTNTSGASPLVTGLPGSASVTLSLFRVIGALALVLAVFFGGLWLFRNWQRLAVHKGRAPKLNVLEAKPLGQRNALYVVAYEQQRMLLATSPAGVTMLTHLPPVEKTADVPENEVSARPFFVEALRRAVTRKS